MRLKTVILVLAFVTAVFMPALCILSLYPLKYEAVVKESSQKYGLDRSVVYAVIKAESNFNPNAVSRRGAKGLMQIMDQTGEWGLTELGFNEDFESIMLFVPEINIELGCWYLNKLIKQYNSIDVALAAYNAGSGNVSKWMDNPDYYDGERLHTIPFKETKDYVRKVNKNRKMYEVLRGIKN